MNLLPRYLFVSGIILFFMSILNIVVSGEITPNLLRANLISSISSVILLLTSSLISKYKSPERATSIDITNQGFVLKDDLSSTVKKELAWGSNIILTATSAITILVYYKKEILLHRGGIGQSSYQPGAVYNQVIEKGELVSLVNTKFYPGRSEFDNVYPGLPSIILIPISSNGIIIIGGNSDRCFTKSDEKWFIGWCQKIESIL